MRDIAQTREAQRIEINSQILNDPANVDKKRPVRVLHVDDDLGFLEISKQILLIENDFEVDFASSVDEAFKRIEKQNYDAIVSDYEMPSRNGLDFLKELREKQNGIPFILFTGKGREEVVVKALNLGADRYLSKNGSPETVYCELADAINKTVIRKKTEEILRKSEERYRELANSVSEMVFECDLTGKIIYINQRAVDFTGFTNQELEGKNMLDFLAPEDRKKAIENMKRSFAGENLGSSEYALFRKDGTTYPTLVRTSRIISENKVVGLRGLVIEIAERKKAEKALREREIHYRLLAEREHMTNEKLNVIGKLTRHDVRNKLSAVKANAYLLKKRVGANPEIANYIASIEQSVEQTESLLEFSRIYEQIGTEQLKTVDVEKCFNEAASFFPELRNLKVTNECQGFSVVADSLLRQLFYNFIDNSMKHGGKISQIQLHYMKEDDEAKLFYEDNGVGITFANKPRTFSEGFTTGKGTGHGLYLAKRMMEVYGWKIEEAGEERKGVKFVMTIPKTKYF